MSTDRELKTYRLVLEKNKIDQVVQAESVRADPETGMLIFYGLDNERVLVVAPGKWIYYELFVPAPESIAKDVKAMQAFGR